MGKKEKEFSVVWASDKVDDPPDEIVSFLLDSRPSDAIPLAFVEIIRDENKNFYFLGYPNAESDSQRNINDKVYTSYILGKIETIKFCTIEHSWCLYETIFILEDVDVASLLLGYII